jgi:hypothetical protein
MSIGDSTTTTTIKKLELKVEFRDIDIHLYSTVLITTFTRIALAFNLLRPGGNCMYI